MYNVWDEEKSLENYQYGQQNVKNKTKTRKMYLSFFGFPGNGLLRLEVKFVLYQLQHFTSDPIRTITAELAETGNINI